MGRLRVERLTVSIRPRIGHSRTQQDFLESGPSSDPHPRAIKIRAAGDTAPPMEFVVAIERGARLLATVGADFEDSRAPVLQAVNGLPVRRWNVLGGQPDALTVRIGDGPGVIAPASAR